MTNERTNEQEATDEVARRLALYRQAIERSATVDMPSFKARLLARISADIAQDAAPMSVAPAALPSDNSEAPHLSPSDAALWETINRSLDACEGSCFSADDIINAIRNEASKANSAKRKAE